MGDAQRRKQASELQLKAVRAAAFRVGEAMQKLAEATSSSLGADCYMHAVLSQIALRTLGIETTLEVGAASWRVGPTPDDSIGHHPNLQAYVPAGAKGLPYHAWLRHEDIFIDTTTYQLRRKGRMLDAATNDGITTAVTWCPPVLVEPITRISSFNAVVKADGPGVFYYEPIPKLRQLLEDNASQADSQDVEALLIVLQNPTVRVLGPNHLGQ